MFLGRRGICVQSFMTQIGPSSKISIGRYSATYGRIGFILNSVLSCPTLHASTKFGANRGFPSWIILMTHTHTHTHTQTDQPENITSALGYLRGRGKNVFFRETKWTNVGVSNRLYCTSMYPKLGFQHLIKLVLNNYVIELAIVRLIRKLCRVNVIIICSLIDQLAYRVQVSL